MFRRLSRYLWAAFFGIANKKSHRDIVSVLGCANTPGMRTAPKLPSASESATSMAEVIAEVKKPLSLSRAEEKLDQLRQRHDELSQQVALVLARVDINGRLPPDLKSVEREARREKVEVEWQINKSRAELIAGRRAHDSAIQNVVAPYLERAKNRLAVAWDETNAAWDALERLRQQMSNCGYRANKSSQPGKIKLCAGLIRSALGEG
jgi:hypothetical protein